MNDGKSKGSRRPEHSEEAINKVAERWLIFYKACDRGDTVPTKGITKRSERHFFEWGQEKYPDDFPFEMEELRSLKRAWQYRSKGKLRTKRSAR